MIETDKYQEFRPEWLPELALVWQLGMTRDDVGAICKKTSTKMVRRKMPGHQTMIESWRRQLG